MPRNGKKPTSNGSAASPEARVVELLERVLKHDGRPIQIGLWKRSADTDGDESARRCFVAIGADYDRWGTGETKGQAVASAIDEICAYFDRCDQAGIAIQQWRSQAPEDIRQELAAIHELCESSEFARELALLAHEDLVPQHLSKFFEAIDPRDYSVGPGAIKRFLKDSKAWRATARELILAEVKAKRRLLQPAP